MSGGSGGPAFPVRSEHGCLNEGMDLRDWFAGQALAGILPSFPQMSNPPAGMTGEQMLAEQSYLLADAMLDARAKGTN